MNKSDLRNFAINARLELLRRVRERAVFYGVDEKSCAAGGFVPSDRFQRPDGAPLSAVEIAQRDALLRRVRETMPEETELYDLAELFKVFGDSTRIRILFVLFEAEVCVCDLAQALGMTQSAISHQLRILKQSRLVKSRREGKSIFYSLADEHVRTIIAQGQEHIEE